MIENGLVPCILLVSLDVSCPSGTLGRSTSISDSFCAFDISIQHKHAIIS